MNDGRRCGGMRRSMPARVPRDIAALDEQAAKVLAAEQREQISHLTMLLRAPWWSHALAAARSAGRRVLQAVASIGERR